MCSVNWNSHRCNLPPMWIRHMRHRPPLYNRCEILYFLTIGSHIKSATAYRMWFNTYHNGSFPDVRSGWHTTSPLVTSVATRCEMLISTDVKCHFCSSVSILHRRLRTPRRETQLEINVIVTIYLVLWATNPQRENIMACQKKAHCLSRIMNQLTFKIWETLTYKYQAPRSMEKHFLTNIWS